MLVGHRHKFIFLKPKKTAGTSVEMWLEPLCTPPGHRPTEVTLPIITKYGIVGARSENAAAQGHDYWNHMSATDLRQRIGAEIFDSYRKIATVRNPFDVMVSAFHHFELPKAAAEGMSRDEVIARFREWIKARPPGFISSISMLLVDGAFCVDTTVRYENLVADCKRCLKEIGANPAKLGPLPEKKRNMRIRDIGLADLYDSECESIVVSAAARDFELLGYSRRVGDVVQEYGCSDFSQTSSFPGTAKTEACLSTTQQTASAAPERDPQMSDDLIYSIFKEIAAVEGKRTPDGTWHGSNANDVQRILSRSFAMVQRASNPNPGAAAKDDKGV